VYRRGAYRSYTISSRRRYLGSIWNFWYKEAKRLAILLSIVEGLA
jgi:hypothetical protein